MVMMMIMTITLIVDMIKGDETNLLSYFKLIV